MYPSSDTLMLIDCFISYYHLTKGIKRLLLISAKLFKGHISIPSFCGLSISQMKEDQFKVFPQNSLKLVMIYNYLTSFAISKKSVPSWDRFQESKRTTATSHRPFINIHIFTIQFFIRRYCEHFLCCRTFDVFRYRTAAKLMYSLYTF